MSKKLKTVDEVFGHIIRGVNDQGSLSFQVQDFYSGGQPVVFGRVRDGKGNKCALGMCVSDDSYKRVRMTIEETNCDVLAQTHADAFDLIEPELKGSLDLWAMLEDVQWIHDDEAQKVGIGHRDMATAIAAFNGRCRVYANDMGYKFPPLL